MARLRGAYRVRAARHTRDSAGGVEAAGDSSKNGIVTLEYGLLPANATAFPFRRLPASGTGKALEGTRLCNSSALVAFPIRARTHPEPT